MKSLGPYSTTYIHQNTLYSSGILGIDNDLKIPSDFNSELNQLFKNIKFLLKKHHLDFKDIIKVNVYLIDLKDTLLLNEYFEKIFLDQYPARTLVEVAKLPKNAKIEIDFIAGI